MNCALINTNCLTCVIALALAGCATVIEPDSHADARSALQSVSVGVGDFAPRIEPREGKPGQRAATEGLIGSAPGLGALAAMAPSCANPIGAGVCVAVMPIFALMAVAGGGIGVVHGGSSGSIKALAHQSLTQALSGKETQDALVAGVMDYGKTAGNPSFLETQQQSATPSSDALLEVAVVKIDSFEVFGGVFGIVATDYAINMEARARLKRVSDGTILADRTYRYLATPRTPQEWLEHDGRPLLETIDYGYRQLAEWIVDDFFLGGYSDFQPSFPTPMAPPVSDCRIGNVSCTSAGLATVPVDSLRPVLRWNADAFSIAPIPTQKPHEAPHVHYELRIYEAKPVRTQYEGIFNKPLWSVLPVYARTDLEESSHALESDLSPCSNYLWTVRAVVGDNGKIRASEWSGKYYKYVPPVRLRNGKNLRVEASLLYGTQFNYAYPFSTPCKG